MKFIRRPLVLIAFALASSLAFGGCASGSGGDGEAGLEASSEVEVVRHTEEELSRLPTGESLRLDLTLEDKAYAISYVHREALERVVVITRDGEHRLTDWAGEALSSDEEVEKQIVLRADRDGDPSQDASVATPDTAVSDCAAQEGAEDVAELEQGLQSNASRIIVACRCPCCIRIGNVLVCC